MYMNPFSWIYEHLIFDPQLNVLNLFYTITGDVGWAIVLLAVLVNVSLWPLFWGTYVNGQKMRLLQPQIKDIQTKYKENPQEMLKQTQAFYKKHKINNGAFFFILVAQIFITIGLFNVTKEVSSGNPVAGLYEIFWGRNDAIFSNTIAFNSLNVGTSASQYIWISVANLILSFAYGWYTFKLAPKPHLREKLEKKLKEKQAIERKKKGEEEKPPAFDPDQMQKMIEFQTIWIFPWLMFFSNIAFTVGVNIYFVTVSLLALIRQFVITTYYSKHEERLLQSIIDSDPTLHDGNPSNNLEITADPALMVDTDPVAEVVVKEAGFGDAPIRSTSQKTNSKNQKFSKTSIKSNKSFRSSRKK